MYPSRLNNSYRRKEQFHPQSVNVWRKDKVFDLWGTGLEREYDLCTFGLVCYREEHVVSLYVSLAFSLKKNSNCLDLPFFFLNILLRYQ